MMHALFVSNALLWILVVVLAGVVAMGLFGLLESAVRSWLRQRRAYRDEDRWAERIRRELRP